MALVWTKAAGSNITRSSYLTVSHGIEPHSFLKEGTGPQNNNFTPKKIRNFNKNIEVVTKLFSKVSGEEETAPSFHWWNHTKNLGGWMVDSVISNQVALKKGWYIHPKLARPVKNFSWRQFMSRSWVVDLSALYPAFEKRGQGISKFQRYFFDHLWSWTIDPLKRMFQSNNAVINLSSLALSKTPWRLKLNRQIYGPDFFPAVAEK